MCSVLKFFLVQRIWIIALRTAKAVKGYLWAMVARFRGLRVVTNRKFSSNGRFVRKWYFLWSCEDVGHTNRRGMALFILRSGLKIFVGLKHDELCPFKVRQLEKFRCKFISS